MKFSDLVQETYSAISSNKTRTALTILGIIIGIGSVVAMISVGEGVKQQIESNIESMGSNLIMVMPGFQRVVGSQARSYRGSAQSLTLEDVEAIETKVQNIKAISPEVVGRYQIMAKGTNTNCSVYGVGASYAQIKNIEIENGSFITQQNIQRLSKVAVLGPTTANDLFGEGINPVGQVIRINKVNFTVIGITQSKGGAGLLNQDDVVYVPINTFQQFLSGDDYVSIINIQVKDQNNMLLVQNDVTNLLLERHNIKNPQEADFSLLNLTDVIAISTSITNILTIFLSSIAGISLLVGGIGIMNMMLTNVTERTKEIGLRKAIGAKSKEITLQFLFESIMLTFIGGIFGIIVGWILSFGVAYFMGITTKISLYSIFLAVGVSAAIGIIFGYYPAKRAATLNPIDALRYE